MTALRHFCAPKAGELRINAEKAGKARRKVCKEVLQEMMMTLSRRWVRGAVWVVLLMAGSVLARAPEVSGGLSGTGMDGKGGSVSGSGVGCSVDGGFGSGSCPGGIGEHQRDGHGCKRGKRKRRRCDLDQHRPGAR